MSIRFQFDKFRVMITSPTTTQYLPHIVEKILKYQINYLFVRTQSQFDFNTIFTRFFVDLWTRIARSATVFVTGTGAAKLARYISVLRFHCSVSETLEYIISESSSNEGKFNGHFPSEFVEMPVMYHSWGRRHRGAVGSFVITFSSWQKNEGWVKIKRREEKPRWKTFFNVRPPVACPLDAPLISGEHLKTWSALTISRARKIDEKCFSDRDKVVFRL